MSRRRFAGARRLLKYLSVGLYLATAPSTQCCRLVFLGVIIPLNTVAGFVFASSGSVGGGRKTLFFVGERNSAIVWGG